MPQDQGSRIIDICIIHTYMHHTHIHQDQESLIYASIHTCIINTGVIDTCIVDTCIIDTCIMDTCISVSCSMLHPTQRFPIQSIHPLIAYATAFLNLKFFAEHPIWLSLSSWWCINLGYFPFQCIDLLSLTNSSAPHSSLSAPPYHQPFMTFVNFPP